MIGLAVLVAVPALAQDEEAYEETLTVVRYLVDVRVTDTAGRAIIDLTPEDFSVKIRGKAAHVESATWVGRGQSTAVPDLHEVSGDPGRAIEEPPGRLLVLFIQTDFGRNAPRIMGQLKFNPIADQIIELLEPNDRVAVFQHDSHLKMRLDFSLDRDATRKAVRDAIRIERLPLPEAAIGPSLVRHLDHDAMQRSTSSESSLLLVADALRELEGSKLMILAGWGLGELQGNRVGLSAGWRQAMGVLHRDKVPVITVSTGLEGGQLTLGLMASSRATGGAYAGSTHSFPQQTLVRVAGALAGYYELVLRADEPLEPGQHTITILTGRRGANVLAPPFVVVDSPGRDGDESTLVSETIDAEKSGHKQTNAGRMFSRAMRHLRNGETEGVEEILTEVIAIDAGYALAWYERGMLAAGRGDNEAALRDLRRYLELEPGGTHAPDVREMLRSFGSAR